MGGWKNEHGLAARETERRSDPRYSVDEESVAHRGFELGARRLVCRDRKSVV